MWSHIKLFPVHGDSQVSAQYYTPATASMARLLSVTNAEVSAEKAILSQQREHKVFVTLI